MKKLFYFLVSIILFSVFSACSIEGIQAPIKGLDGKDGEDGFTTYIELQENSPNQGQTTVISWTDYDRDGILDDNEVKDVAIINDGQDGKTTIIETEVIEPGELCSYGGILIRTITDDEETVVFICCCGCEEEKLEVCYYDEETGDLYFMYIPASEVQELIDNGAFLGSCKDWQYED